MQKVIVVFLFVAVFNNAKAQTNLVPNHSFEIYTTCPITNGNFNIDINESVIQTLSFSQKIYAEVIIDGVTMTPRQSLKIVPYSHTTYGVMNSSTAPLNPQLGSVYLNAVSGLLEIYNASGWTNVGNTAVIGDGSVTTSKLANDSVNTLKLGADAVTTAKIIAAAITTAKINDLAVTTVKIADTAVTLAKKVVR